MDVLYLIETLGFHLKKAWSNEKIIFEWLSLNTFSKTQLVCTNVRAVRSELIVKEKV